MQGLHGLQMALCLCDFLCFLAYQPGFWQGLSRGGIERSTEGLLFAQLSLGTKPSREPCLFSVGF